MRLFFWERPAPQPPTNEATQLSGFLVNETQLDRLERIYADSLELMRRGYANLEWSRRAMREHAMGPRRWASAHALLVHSSCLRANGEWTFDDPVMARRKLRECRIHYESDMKKGARHTLPF